jgi:hypothetical protein
LCRHRFEREPFVEFTPHRFGHENIGPMGVRPLLAVCDLRAPNWPELDFRVLGHRNRVFYLVAKVANLLSSLV